MDRPASSQFKAVKDRVIAACDNHGVITAYVFGSVANGDDGVLSDVDIALLPGDQTRFIDVAMTIAGLFDDADIVNAADASLPLQYSVIKGNPFYVADHTRRVRFETRVMQDYLDRKQFYDDYADKQLKRRADETRHRSKT